MDEGDRFLAHNSSQPPAYPYNPIFFLLRGRVRRMEYEVCAVVVSLSFIRIDFYKSVEDYERGRPATIYVILRRNILSWTSPILSKSEVYVRLRESYKDADIVVLDENEKEAVRVYCECKRARRFVSIPPLLSHSAS